MTCICTHVGVQYLTFMYTYSTCKYIVHVCTCTGTKHKYAVASYKMVNVDTCN